jgi:hypothetical protein
MPLWDPESEGFRGDIPEDCHLGLDDFWPIFVNWGQRVNNFCETQSLKSKVRCLDQSLEKAPQRSYLVSEGSSILTANW